MCVRVCAPVCLQARAGAIQGRGGQGLPCSHNPTKNNVNNPSQNRSVLHIPISLIFLQLYELSSSVTKQKDNSLTTSRRQAVRALLL